MGPDSGLLSLQVKPSSNWLQAKGRIYWLVCMESLGWRGGGLARSTSGFRCAKDGEGGTCLSRQPRVSVPAPFLGGCASERGGGRWLSTSQPQVPGRKGACLSALPTEVPGKTLVDRVTRQAGGFPRGNPGAPEASGKDRCLVGKVGGGLICRLRQWRKEGPGGCGTGMSPTVHLSRGSLPPWGARDWEGGGGRVYLGRGMKALGCRRPPHLVPGHQPCEPSLGMGPPLQNLPFKVFRS